MKKIFFMTVLIMLLTVSVFGQGRKYYNIQIVDEWNDPKTDLTSITISTAAGGTATLYTTEHGSTEYGSSGIDDGAIAFWYEATTLDLSCTDGTQTRTAGDMSITTHTVMFPTFLNALSGSTYGQTDDIDFTYGNWIIDADTSNRLDMIPDNDSGILAIGDGSTQADVYIYATSGDYIFFDEGNALLDFIDINIDLDDDSYLRFGTSNDITMKYDGSGNDLDILGSGLEIAFGEDNEGIDVIMYGETSGAYTIWDESANQLVGVGGAQISLNDSVELLFGTGSSNAGDFSVTGNGTGPKLVIDVVSAGSGEIEIGNDADDVPMKWFGETTGDFVYFTGDDLQIEDMSLCLADSTQLQFGDPLGTGDIKIYASGTALVIDGVVADTGSVTIGVDDHGLDFQLFPATASDYLLWDASDEDLKFVGTNLVLDSDSGLENPPVAVTDASTYTVTVANSGKLHAFPDLTADCTITLPTEASGLYYKFIYAGAAEDAQDWIFQATANANYFKGGVVQHDDDDAGDDTVVYYSDGNSNSQLTVYTPNAGTCLEIWCNGTNWYLNGTVISGTDTGVAFADQ